MKKVLTLSLFALILTLPALDCSVCKHKISGRYLSSDNRVFCSEKCYSTTWPVCSVCHKASRNYLRSGDRIFCSEKCYNTTLAKCAVCNALLRGNYRSVFSPTGESRKVCVTCFAAPACFACTLPARDLAFLTDGRRICRTCAESAVTDPGEARELFKRAEMLVGQELSMPGSCGKVSLFLVTDPELARRSGHTTAGRELGLYSFEENLREITTTKYSLSGPKEETRTEVLNRRCAIYILSHLPRNQFVEVAAHELAHDWMRHHLPQIRDPRIQEGFAEYIASRVNLRNAQPKRNFRMENNTDPVYGDGYRKVRDAMKSGASVTAALRSL